jgi:hypothetical protein
MISFMREEREMILSAMETQRQQMETLLEQERQQNIKLREQALCRDKEQAQVALLLSRVQALHTAQLVTDEELYRIEEIIVDGCEIDEAADGAGAGDGQVTKMVALSGRLSMDGVFARQLRRKFL